MAPATYSEWAEWAGGALRGCVQQHKREEKMGTYRKFQLMASMALVALTLFAVSVLATQVGAPLVSSTSTGRGQIVQLFPPGNDGSQPGAGLISERNASGGLTGPPFRVFQTPQDVVPGQELSEGLDVNFEPVGANQATEVKRDVF